MSSVVLKLESINHNMGMPPEMMFLLHVLTGERIKNRYWVAEVVGLSRQYKYERSFLRGKVDYSRANSKGTRGVYAYYTLEDGKIYDVREPMSWRRSERYFCTVKNGQIVKIKEQEVQVWLRDRSESTSSKPLGNA